MALCTLGLLLITAVVVPTGCPNVLEDPDYADWPREELSSFRQWSLSATMVYTVFFAAVAVWIVLVARTQYLRYVAIYVLCVWASNWSRTLRELLRCEGLAWLLEYLAIGAFRTAHFCSVVMFGYMAIDRIRKLEAASFIPLGANRMIVLGKVLILVTIGDMGLYFLVPNEVFGVWHWTVYAGYSIFFMLGAPPTLRIYAQVGLRIPSSWGRLSSDAVQAAALLHAQIRWTVLGMATSLLSNLWLSWMLGNLWPVPSPKPSRIHAFAATNTFWGLDAVFNCLAVASLNGIFSGAASRYRLSKEEEKLRCKRWKEKVAALESHSNQGWQEKVEDLASRGFTVESLLRFYKGLGKDYMPHFTPEQSTTTDVVRHAIIPLSAAQQVAYSSIMMGGRKVAPNCMVTHNWSNLFHDLVAAILADALDEPEYCMIMHLLDTDIEQLEAWLTTGGLNTRSYWVCAFCINQHTAICGGNPDHSLDSVTNEEHPICSCGMPKVFNNALPALSDGRSVECELNKFDDMMKFLSSQDKTFGQIIAVDARFDLFTRAWCVAEIAAAFDFGMSQALKFCSSSHLKEHEEDLKSIQIQNMNASRPEDKAAILESIPDHDEFNNRIQTLLFRDLLPSWKGTDAARQMEVAGHILRWQLAVGSNASWHKSLTASLQAPKRVKRPRPAFDFVTSIVNITSSH